MNISINNICNNNCSYCFQSTYNNVNEAKYITLEHYEKILDFLNHTIPEIRILGGEPTLHPQIVEIIKLTIEKEYRPILITNLLIHNKNTLIELSKIKDLVWFTNGTHSDLTFSLFEENLKFLLDIPDIQIGISFCLTENEDDNQKVLDRIFYLCDKYKNYTLNFRVSPASPNHKSYKIINYSNWFKKIIKIIEDYHNFMVFDCPVPFCLIDKEIDSSILNSPALNHQPCDLLRSKCTGALDILLDDKLYLCNSYRDIGVPIFDYPDFDSCYGALMFYISQDIQGKNYEYCDKNCKHFIECNGFCPAILHAFDKEKLND